MVASVAAGVEIAVESDVSGGTGEAPALAVRLFRPLTISRRMSGDHLSLFARRIASKFRQPPVISVSYHRGSTEFKNRALEGVLGADKT